MELRRREMMAGLAAAGLLPGCAGAGRAGAVAAPALAPLEIYGATMTVEIAPLLLAVRDHYPGTTVKLGGVVNLIGPEKQADVAANAETQLLRQSMKRPDMRIIMTMVEGLYRIVARRSAGIATMADLKGKRVGTLRATSADYFLSKMLATAGLKDSDVTVTNVIPLDKLETQMVAHELDAVSMWEPFSENVLRAIGGDAIEFSGKGVYRELYNINTTQEALDDPAKRRAIVELLRHIIRTNAAMQADPSEAQALVVENGGYPLEQVQHCWHHHGWTAGFADDMLDVLEDEEIWLAAQEKRAPRSRAQLAPLIDRSVYEEALAGL